MSTSASAISIARPGRDRGRGHIAATTVGDYVGHSAAHAARAVRRAGLRPGLDRAFGSDPELTGTIVAQDPTAGSALTRNAMVTLYVAAPGSPHTQDTLALGLAEGVQAAGSVGRDATTLGGSARTRTQTGARRARKPRAASSAGANHPSGASLHAAHRGDAAQPRPGSGHASAAPFTAHACPQKEPDVQVSNMFAAAGELAPWRRAYPRRPVLAVLRRPIRWARSHPILAPVAAATLALWIAVAAAGGLAPRGARERLAVADRTSGVASQKPLRQPGIRVARASRSRVPARGRTRRAQSISATLRVSRRRRDPGRSAMHRSALAYARPAISSRGSSLLGSGAAAPASVASSPRPSPVAAQSSGGPFSP